MHRIDGSGGPVWQISTRSGAPGELHAASAQVVAGPESPGRLLTVVEAESNGLILGSAQPESHVDHEAVAVSGAELVRRRSGGGAVLVGPGLVLWVDLVIPTADPLWDDDVGRAAWWVGERWAAALEEVGLCGADVWKGPMVRSRFSSAVCFAGIGPGEVRVEGRKVVGIAQRRTRFGALFQTAALVDWNPEATLSLLDLGVQDRRRALEELSTLCVGVGRRNAESLLTSLIHAVTG